MKTHIPHHPVISRRLGWLTLIALSLTSLVQAETILVESRTADGKTNSPAWTIVSGRWGQSKNKSKVEGAGFSATNVVVCTYTNPLPAFKIAPPGIKAGNIYKMEVTFTSTKNQPASTDLVVAVQAAGVTKSTIPATTMVFQRANANAWTEVGTFTAATNQPAFTFTYVSGTLSTNPPTRWYADSVRFVSESGKSDAKP